MRLTKEEAKLIKKAFLETFKDGKVYLFGSRIDDSKRGGDIDLYLRLPYELSTKEILDKKSRFKIKLYDYIGEQKIDIVIAKDRKNNFEEEINRTKVVL